MKTSFNLFTILVIWLCIDGLNGDALCEVCSDSNDPNCLKVELKQCSSNEQYCMDAYFKPSAHVKSPKGRLIKQCATSSCPEFNGTHPDICDYCINTLKDKCNKNKTIDHYVKLLEGRCSVGPVIAFLADVEEQLSLLKWTMNNLDGLSTNQMVQKAKKQLATAHAKLHDALGDLLVMEESERKASAPGSVARSGEFSPDLENLHTC